MWADPVALQLGHQQSPIGYILSHFFFSYIPVSQDSLGSYHPGSTVCSSQVNVTLLPVLVPSSVPGKADLNNRRLSGLAVEGQCWELAGRPPLSVPDNLASGPSCQLGSHPRDSLQERGWGPKRK